VGKQPRHESDCSPAEWTYASSAPVYRHGTQKDNIVMSLSNNYGD
jgi:hypothetical protein